MWPLTVSELHANKISVIIGRKVMIPSAPWLLIIPSWVISTPPKKSHGNCIVSIANQPWALCSPLWSGRSLLWLVIPIEPHELGADRKCGYLEGCMWVPQLPSPLHLCKEYWQLEYPILRRRSEASTRETIETLVSLWKKIVLWGSPVKWLDHFPNSIK